MELRPPHFQSANDFGWKATLVLLFFIVHGDISKSGYGIGSLSWHRSASPATS